MPNKLIKRTTLMLAITSFALLFSTPTKALATCTTPTNVGTLSTGRDEVEVGWTVPSATIPPSPTADIGQFQVAYAKAGESFTIFTDNVVLTTAGTPDPDDNNLVNYSYTFTGLTENETYYWQLRTICNPITPDVNGDQLRGFITKPTLDITGFLLVDGQIQLSRRIEIKSDFSYLVNPIFSVLTTSVGSGRLHVISVD